MPIKKTDWILRIFIISPHNFGTSVFGEGQSDQGVTRLSHLTYPKH